MFSRLRSLLMLLLVASMVVQAWAAPGVRFSELSILLPPTDTGIAFFTVTSDQDDAITAMTTACCKAAELHQSSIANGVMQMRQMDSVPLKAGVPTVFGPGGLHVMLIGIKTPFTAGQQVPLTFRFAHAPEQTVLFTVTDPRLHSAQ